MRPSKAKINQRPHERDTISLSLAQFLQGKRDAGVCFTYQDLLSIPLPFKVQLWESTLMKQHIPGRANFWTAQVLKSELLEKGTPGRRNFWKKTFLEEDAPGKGQKTHLSTSNFATSASHQRAHSIGAGLMRTFLFSTITESALV